MFWKVFIKNAGFYPQISFVLLNFYLQKKEMGSRG